MRLNTPRWRPLALSAALLTLPSLASAQSEAPAAQKAPEGPAVERRLHPQEVASSSFLWNSWNEFQENYHPIYAFDGDRRTAWVEGAKDQGKGEWLRAQVTPMEGATQVRLRLRSGYQKSKGLFRANSRPSSVTVTLAPSGQTATFPLKDAQGWQEIVIEQPAGRLEAISLKVDDVYAGRKYTDTCLSDVEIYATATTRENPAAERAHLKRIKAWKADRLKAARLFKAGQKQHVPLAPRYSLTADKALTAVDLEGCEWDDQTCRMRGLVKGMKAQLPEAPGLAPLLTRAEALLATLPGAEGAPWQLAQVVPRDKRPFPRLDHLAVSELWEALEGPMLYVDEHAQKVSGHLPLPITDRVGDLSAEGLAFFDVKGKAHVGPKGQLADAGCTDKEGVQKTLTWIHAAQVKGEKRQADAIFAAQCGGVETRGGAEAVEALELMVYDDQGRLGLLVSPHGVVHYTWRDGEGGPILTAGVRVSGDGSGVRMAEASTLAAR